MKRVRSVFDYASRQKIKRMYIKREMMPQEIADELNQSLKPGQKPFSNHAIGQWCSNNGLVKQRKAMRIQVTNLIESSELKHVTDISEFNEEISERSRLMTLQGLDGMETAIDGKDFSGYANGTSKMYDVFRKAEGLDTQVIGLPNPQLNRIHALPVRRVNSLPVPQVPSDQDLKADSIEIEAKQVKSA